MKVRKYLGEPMQGKGRVEEVDRPGRKKPPVKRTGNSGGEVRAVGVGSQTVLHGAGVVGERREEVEKGVEVVAGEVGEEGGELRGTEAGSLVALGHVLDDGVHHGYGVGAAGASEVHHHIRFLWTPHLHSV